MNWAKSAWLDGGKAAPAKWSVKVQTSRAAGFSVEVVNDFDAEIEREIGELGLKARDGQLKLEDLQGAVEALTHRIDDLRSGAETNSWNEIRVRRDGYTIVPTAMYWKGNKVKLEIALAKGKQSHDKREASKERDWAREKQRLLRRHNKDA